MGESNAVTTWRKGAKCRPSEHTYYLLLLLGYGHGCLFLQAEETECPDQPVSTCGQSPRYDTVLVVLMPCMLGSFADLTKAHESAPQVLAIRQEFC
jgi:hypothetical protein